MPVRSRALGPADVLRFAEDCFAPSTEPCWGLEVETLVGRQADPATRPGVAELPTTEPLPDGSSVCWRAAARHGLDHPDLAHSADLLLDLAAAEVPRVSSRPERISALHSFRATYARARRTPGRAQQGANDPAVQAPAVFLAE